ncbi:MAG: HAMP domain-containing sensor histidine kinase [Niabella sp.]
MVRYWKWLMGNENIFTLEVRIFHAVCVLLVLCILISVPVAYGLHIPHLPLMLVIVSSVAGVLYYLSRFKGFHQLSAAIFQVFLCLGLTANYYYNSGVNGPSYAMFLLAFLVSVLTSPTRQYFIWLPVNMLLLTGLITLELVVPGSIRTTYLSATDRYIDLVATYFITAGFAFFIAAYVRTAYNKQREQLIAQSAALHEANNTKNKLLSILGHDLKEPLASLQGYLQLLSDFDMEEEERREMNEQLLLMTKSASLMLSNILAWTNKQGHSIQVDLRDLSVKETLWPVIQLSRSISHKKQISLWLDLPENINVKADSQMLELIVRNLLMNAIKFTPAEGNIWLSAKTEGDRCMLEVKDDGIGIPEALRSNIFSINPGSRRGTASEKGTGLGLRLCKEFTEMLGGELTFKNNDDKGTTFSLTLPAVNISGISSEIELEIAETC